MANVNLTGVPISVELLEKRFAKEKIADKLNAVLKSQKKRTETLIANARKFALEIGENPDRFILKEFQIRINLMVYVINTAMCLLLSNEQEDSLDELILVLLTKENAKLNVEAYERKLQSLKAEYELYVNQEKFDEMCEHSDEFPNDYDFRYLS